MQEVFKDLGATTFEKDGPGALRVMRLELLRAVEPAVSVAISPLNGVLESTFITTALPAAIAGIASLTDSVSG